MIVRTIRADTEGPIEMIAAGRRLLPNQGHPIFARSQRSAVAQAHRPE
jgi:hypothetical protein